MKVMRFQSYYFQLEKGTPLFLKKFLFRRRSISKLKYWKRSKVPLIVSLKHTDLSNRKLFWKCLVSFFSKTYVLSVGFKMKPLKKAFSSVNTKASPNFAVKPAERSNYSLLLSIWWITFFITCTFWIKHSFSLFFPIFPCFYGAVTYRKLKISS